MMLSGKKKKRVEPRFENGPRSRGSGVLSVTDEDRAAPPQKSGKKKSASKSSARRSQKPKSGPARRKKTKSTKRSGSLRFKGRGLIGAAFYWSFILGIWGAVGIGGVLLYYGAQLPSASTWAVPDRPPNVKIVAVDGALIANRGATGGEEVGVHEMSPYIPQAIVAIEDKRFYSHFGVDPIGLTRAMIRNVSAGRLVQGGSTLTQQLAKNLFLTPERTIGRKVQEVLLAFWLEHEYTKDQILEMYLNRVYFGSGAYGVEAASRRYFNVSARDVSLPEAALLAGLVKAPSRLSPARNPQAAERRAQIVLGAMRAQGMVTDNEMTAAMSRAPTRAAARWSGSEHYVADAVMDRLPELIGEIRTDLIVDTTIDRDLQRFGESAIRDLISERGGDHKVSQAALVSIDTTGAVRAMIGGYDYGDSQFDRAREAKRQPGSAFKPFVYLTALEQGRTPTAIRNDAPIKIGKWTPENYKGRYHGPVTLTTALSKSLNSVAAQLIMETGPGNVVKTARRMGIESDLKANASLALGTSEVTLLELTTAYLPFASGGYAAREHIIQRVTTADGKVLYEAKPERQRVLSPEIAGMMNAMMSKTVTEGTASGARFDHPAAGKTGTTQDSRDAWFIGYSANLTTGVWFGNDDGSSMKNVTGGSLPVEAWRSFMVRGHEGVPIAELPGYRPITIVPQPRPREFLVQQRSSDGHNQRAHSSDVTVNRDQMTTSATGIPRPPAELGDNDGPVRNRSVLDILLGR